MSSTFDRVKALEIISRHFASVGISLDELTPNSLFETIENGLIQFRWQSTGPFDKLLESKGFNDRRGSNELYYHFRDLETATSIISDCSLHLNNLSWQKDEQEFLEFYERTGLWNKATGFAYIPVDSAGSKVEVWSPEEIKQYIHVLCLSRAISERHWSIYAGGKDGVCFLLQVIDKSNDPAGRKFYELRDVFYDSGKDFDFIQEMQADLVKEIGYPLNLARVPILASMTKRKSEFDWEIETRLTIDWQYIIASYNKDPDIEFGCVEVDAFNNRHYLRRRLGPKPFSDEKHFKIRVRGILWGPDIAPDLKSILESQAVSQFPGVKMFNSESEAISFVRTFKFEGDKEPDPTDSWLKEMKGDSTYSKKDT